MEFHFIEVYFNYSLFRVENDDERNRKQLGTVRLWACQPVSGLGPPHGKVGWLKQLRGSVGVIAEGCSADVSAGGPLEQREISFRGHLLGVSAMVVLEVS